MGKASSSKKVARAARAGGRSAANSSATSSFPASIGGIMLARRGARRLRGQRPQGRRRRRRPSLGDHWHAAFGVYICGAFQPDLARVREPPSASTPTATASSTSTRSPAGGAGENATLGAFLEDAGVDAQRRPSSRIGDETWKEGDQKCGDEDGELVVAHWKDVENTDEKPALIHRDFDDIRFRDDGEGYTIAFVPEGTTDIPPPESAAQLPSLGAADDPTARPPRPTRRRPTDTTAAGDGRRTTAPTTAAADDDRTGRLTCEQSCSSAASAPACGRSRCHRPSRCCRSCNRPMIERVVGHLAGHGVDDVGPVARATGPTPSRRPTPTARCAGVDAALRRRARAARHRRRHPLRRRSTPASTSASSWSTATCSPTSTSRALVDVPRRARGAEGTIALHRVDDPSALRRRAHRRRRPGHGLHREAAARARRPTDLINAGTYVLEPSVLDRIAAGRPVLGRAGDLPGAWSPTARLFALDGDDLLDRRRHARRRTSRRQPRPARRPPRRAPSPAVATPTPRSTGAVVRRSVVGPGVGVEAGAVVVGLRACCAGATVRRRRRRARAAIVGARRRGRRRAPWSTGLPCSATTWSWRPARASTVRGIRRLPGGRARCGRWSPAEPGSSARRWSTACWPRATSVDVVDDLSSGLARQPGRGPGRPHQPAHGPPDRHPRRRRRRPDRPPRARGRVPPRRPGRRAGLGRPARVRRRGQRGRQPQRPRGRPARRAPARSCSPRAAARSTASRAPRDLPVKESHPQQPLSPYGVAKQVVTDYLHVYRELHSTSSSPSLALANIYGPRQDPHGEAGVVAIFAGLLLAGEAVHGLRRRRADPRLRLRRRRRRRLRAGRRPRRAGSLVQHRHRRRDVGQRRSTRRWPPPPASTAQPVTRRGPARRAPAHRPRPRPGRPSTSAGSRGPTCRRGRRPGPRLARRSP